ncbi:hypothetical protein [Nonomuraea rubra]|uniref:hypothetical protein n=1 Tax=Nonomuraea rubra TaxID=46180 RepID=UPI0034028952
MPGNQAKHCLHCRCHVWWRRVGRAVRRSIYKLGPAWITVILAALTLIVAVLSLLVTVLK